MLNLASTFVDAKVASAFKIHFSYLFSLKFSIHVCRCYFSVSWMLVFSFKAFTVVTFVDAILMLKAISVTPYFPTIIIK